MYAHTMENKWVVEKWKYYQLPWVAYRVESGLMRHRQGFATWQEAFDYAFNRAISAYLAADEQSSTDYQ